ncbi:site-specific DNA-methyltransferase [Crenothrix polyspora]|uniref:site-specific DNA-methyltransferase (adenine-specific) n=1 Tax=Crenothrix polyspora TaxID=360316 RepID=A0A1R4H436_9GAMM|nr:site-specific DNA-methyltransferase [Crenothrix polyspora]SJM91012.1 conserved hypothetical protein [Crenothrix polyspora]
MSKYDDLVIKLKEIFQIDKPELDFGIYRILNARVGEINDYLENRLKAKVSESLANSGAANKDALLKELKDKESQYRADGIDPDTVPKLREIREKLADYGAGSLEHENAVFSHLLTFFSRYYDKGDFISQRRYKGDTYAIPYAGEEVVLHWANKDQYYTKSGENFSNYAFKLDDGRSVRFRLVTADTAKDNRKDNDKERRFVLIEPTTRIIAEDDGDEIEETLLPITEENGELVIRFEYKAMPKGSKQDELVQNAVKALLADAQVKARWLDLAKREPTEKNPQRTLLEKMLTNYTAKNTADYFIHKDLGGFLRRELDFYIKNEVMHLDDVQHAETFADIEKNLRLIQTLRAIALDLVTFLAQLEDFQKKLWLKKKFVVSTQYCMTLDRVPESLYPAIAANPLQWEQWEQLGMLDGDKADVFKQAEVGSVDYLKEHPFLMVDTTLFDVAFKHALLAAVDNLDESLDGLLIHGDNFQALNLLQERYREQVKCVYIDPPYNTGGDGFSYKDNYQHSSWMSMFENRAILSRTLMQQDSVFFCSTDDIEQASSKFALGNVFGMDNFISNIIWQKKYAPANDAKWLSDDHDYVSCFALDKNQWYPTKLIRSDKQNQGYTNPDNDSRGSWMSDNYTCNKSADERPNLYYPIINPNTGVEIWPSNKAVWRYSKGFHEKNVQENLVWWGKNGDNSTPRYKRFLNNLGGVVPRTIWMYEDVGHTQDGIRELRALIPETFFTSPKTVRLIKRVIHIAGVGNILDYFAGSGTTAHAVIDLNREDSGKRKYILVEQGDYFDTVLKPRIQKVVYSADWKDGKATAPHTGLSHAFKTLKIESYEDTLNNLQLRRTQAQQSTLDSLSEAAQEDYLLRYMLDIESRGSLLSVQHFNKPFDCKLKVAIDSAGAYQERNIDLIETFNYLIGLRVKHIDSQRDKGFITLTGWLPCGEKTLILWRDVEQVDYDTLNRLCDKLAINPADSEFEIVYINGDHNIPAVFTNLETEGGITKTLKIRQIEPEFLNRMFAVEGN